MAPRATSVTWRAVELGSDLRPVENVPIGVSVPRRRTGGEGGTGTGRRATSTFENCEGKAPNRAGVPPLCGSAPETSVLRTVNGSTCPVFRMRWARKRRVLSGASIQRPGSVRVWVPPEGKG